MKSILLTIISVVAALSVEFPTEEGVLILTDSTFSQAIDQYNNLLAGFYAPWNAHCKMFLTEYARAAQQLAETDLDIKLAKIDFTVEKELALKYDIKHYPTIILFSRALGTDPIHYTGPRTTSDMIEWQKKKIIPSSVEIKNTEEAQNLIENNELSVLFLGLSGTEAHKNFLETSIGSEEVAFAHTSEQTVANYLDAPPNSVVLFRKNNEERAIYTEAMSIEAIKSFINQNKTPNFFPFTEKAAQKIFGENLDTLFLIRGDDERSKKAEEVLKVVAKELKGKVVFSVTNINDSFGEKLAEFFAVNRDHLPTFKLFRAQKNLKYSFEDEINIQNIKSFVQSFIDNKLKPSLKSEPLPKLLYQNNAKVVVGKNFDEVVLDKDNDVLIVYYFPWDSHYKAFAPVYADLATKLKDVQGITVAMMNYDANEVEGLKVNWYPYIRLYPKDKKTEPLDYNGELTVEALLDYLRAHSTFAELLTQFTLIEL